MIPYENLLDIAFNRPLLITPQKADIIGAVLLRRVDARGGRAAGDQGIEEFQTFEPTTNADGSTNHHSPRASRFLGAYPIDEKGKPAPYRTHNGVAIITIVGSLVNRGAWIGASSGLVSYEGVMHQLSTAVADERVKSILLDIQSPGGEAVGCFEVAAAVRKAAETKTVIGFVNGMACSAAYAILSGCTQKFTTPSGISGSIGVVMMHLDFSRYLANEGVKPTFIHAGAHKVDGNPYEPLADNVKADLQAEVDQFYAGFVACVSAGTGLSEEAIRATEARTYIGEEAVKVGLVDKVATIDEIIEAMTSTEIIPQEAGAIPPIDGTAKAAATEGDSMSLWTQLKQALGGVEPEASAETPASIAPDVTPEATTEVTKEGPVHLGTPSITVPDTFTDADLATLEAGIAAEYSSYTILRTSVTSASTVFRSLCGRAESPGSGLSATLDCVTCADCLRGEISQRDERAKIATSQAEADAKAKAEAERATRIESEVKSFASKLSSVGKDATSALVSRYRVAKESDDAAAIADLETVAASFPTAPWARIEGSEGGPSAEEIAKRVTQGGDHFAALEIVSAKGITQHSPSFGVEYGKALASLSTGGARG